jgi:carboxyl-terminal processing protease
MRMIFLLAGAWLAAATWAGAAGARVPSYSRLSVEQRADMQREVRVLISLLESYHYRSRPFVELEARDVLEAYMNRIDSRRAWLLATDEQFIQRRFGRSLKSSYLLSGDLYPAYEIFDLLRERFEARQAWIQRRLDQPFDVAGDGTFSGSRAVAKRPASAAEADRLWGQILTAEFIEQMLRNPDEAWARERLRRRYNEQTTRLAAVGTEDVEEMFLNAILSLQDPHSGYDSWDTQLDRDVEMTGSLVGIGADLKIVDGAVVVERLVPGGAADLSGEMQPGDRIEAAAEDGAEPAALAGMSLQEVVRRMRGKADSRLVLTVRRPGVDATRTVALARKRVQVSETRARAVLFDVPQDGGVVRVGAIVLPVFYGDPGAESEHSSAGADVHELLGKLAAAGAQAVVLDLRDNPGGLVTEAARVAGQFIVKGPVLITRDASGVSHVTADDDPAVAWAGPLVVLTSVESASASEVVAGALRAYGRAVVAGEGRTFGKGTSQMVIPLREVGRESAAQDRSHWGALRLTGQRFYLPDGDTSQERGVASDLLLPARPALMSRTETDLPGALPWNTIPRPEFAAEKPEAMRDLAPVSPELLAHLRERLAVREQTLPEFAWWRRRIAIWEEWFGREAMELNLERERQRQDAIDQRRRESGQERRLLARESGFATQLVRLDAVIQQDEAHQARLRREAGPAASSRAGRVIDDIYYHRPAPDGPLHEVRLTGIQLSRYRDDAPELVDDFNRAAGDLALTSAQLGTVLVEHEEAGVEDESPFAGRLAAALRVEADDPRLQAGLAALCARLVELDPTLLGEPRPLDVHLRESLRLAADWWMWQTRRGAAATGTSMR